jgi:hypothetical protein
MARASVGSLRRASPPDPDPPENKKGTPLTLAVLVLAVAC